MRPSNFTTLFVLAILMTIGAAVMPLIDTSEQPRAKQGRSLAVSYTWSGTPAKVIEQNVTSKIEGMVSAVKGVQATESESRFGSGRVVVELKPEVSVSAVKFEILSLIRQVYKQLPEGVSFPNLSGGNVVGSEREQETMRLLNYQINAAMSGNQLREYIRQFVEKELRNDEDIKRVDVTGAQSRYIEISYDPSVISVYGITANDIEQAIRSFMGREDIVGEVLRENVGSGDGAKQRMSLYLVADKFARELEQMPIKQVDGKMVYLNNLVTFEYKERLPNSYFRVNGLNTINLNIFVDADADKILLSRKLRDKVDEASGRLKEGVYLTLVDDAAEKAESELGKLIGRTLLALAILLAFVWIVGRSVKYLSIITLSILANILISAIVYWLLDMRLHIYSLAGITVSIGLIIDATVVMVDHYSYYRNRRAFLAILAALLTTIGSLVVVFWLPEFLQKDLYDFALIIIVNLSVALFVAYLFSPALIDVMDYHSQGQGQSFYKRKAVRWKRFYTAYIGFIQKRKWIYVILLLLTFGIPFHALPDSLLTMKERRQFEMEGLEFPWYVKAYDKTFGSSFFQMELKEPLSKIFGGTMRLFAESMPDYAYGRNDRRELKLDIRAKMPLGGSVHELNEKVSMLESFLSGFKEIKRFETRVNAGGASVNVEFTDEAQETSFPYVLENKVIGRVITIGGAEWSTRGVSERGFSNSLNLQHRSYRIEIAGYNYDRLYRIAEDMCERMKMNNRVVDLTIETPGFEHQEDEFYMQYDKQRMALYDFNVSEAHTALSEILEEREIKGYRDRYISANILMKPSEQDSFDLWHLGNAQVKTADGDIFLTDFMDIERREAKNCIPKRNQEYVLRVAFNVLGSYTYTSKFMDRTIEEFNAMMPVGFRCQNVSWNYYKDTGTQYWLLLLIVIIVYFICAILFESLRLPLAILSLVPVSFIGAFLTYYFTGVNFGTGGFASLVLLCGLTVNAGIYIISEYLGGRALQSTDRLSVKNYVRAYNHKVRAVFLTVLSTVLGLIPFFIDGASEPFWFSFAVGASGGLLFSIIALVFVMPIFMKFQEKGKVVLKSHD